MLQHAPQRRRHVHLQRGAWHRSRSAQLDCVHDRCRGVRGVRGLRVHVPGRRTDSARQIPQPRGSVGPRSAPRVAPHADPLAQMSAMRAAIPDNAANDRSLPSQLARPMESLPLPRRRSPGTGRSHMWHTRRSASTAQASRTAGSIDYTRDSGQSRRDLWRGNGRMDSRHCSRRLFLPWIGERARWRPAEH